MSVYQINEPQVIYEIIDGEVVVINLDKGHYYSFEHIGTQIWELLINKVDLANIYKFFQSNFKGEKDQIESAISEFIADLEKEELIRKSDLEKTELNQIINDQEKDSEIFKSPAFQKFTDMEDLLLLDPIHDVDETGWPSLKDD